MEIQGRRPRCRKRPSVGNVVELIDFGTAEGVSPFPPKVLHCALGKGGEVGEGVGSQGEVMSQVRRGDGHRV